MQPTTSTAVPSSANAANQNAAPSNRSAADPQISADLNPALVLPGDTVTLTILITNQGETTAQNVVVRAVMPSAWSLLALNTTQGSYSLVDQTAQIVPVRYVRQSRSQAINQKTLIVRIGSMLPGQQVHISAQIQVAASASAGATIVDDLTLSADGLPVIRTALASMRVTAGALPFTGERPDRAADHSGLLFALLVAMASGIVLFSRRRAA